MRFIYTILFAIAAGSLQSFENKSFAAIELLKKIHRQHDLVWNGSRDAPFIDPKCSAGKLKQAIEDMGKNGRLWTEWHTMQLTTFFNCLIGPFELIAQEIAKCESSAEIEFELPLWKRSIWSTFRGFTFGEVDDKYLEDFLRTWFNEFATELDKLADARKAEIGLETSETDSYSADSAPLIGSSSRDSESSSDSSSSKGKRPWRLMGLFRGLSTF